MSRSPDATPRLSDLTARLATHVDRLAGLIGPRHLGKPRAFHAAAEYVARQLAEFHDDVRRETYPVQGELVDNVFIELPGGEKPREIVILGAHYDTVDTTPGADDNASAVAVLIEAARLLARQPLPRTVRCIAFACEEPPHFHGDTMGSQVHARGCRERGENLTAMICLEMVGYYSDEPDSQTVPEGIPRWLRPLFPRRGNFLAAVGNLPSVIACATFRMGFKPSSRLPLFSIVLPERIHEIRLSDNASFWDEGFPALMVTDTSFLRNPHYHLQSDTPETLDYARMAEATHGVAGGVARLAGSHVRFGGE
jgi:Zn-dependent M28 family amino/carboxypeptidase